MHRDLASIWREIDVDDTRLKRLAALQDSHNTVLSLYLDLDPERFATPPARMGWR